jgi:predicted Rdx family selenoprotein
MGTVTLPRPDLAAHRRAVQAPFSEMVAEVVELLGKKLTAYIGGVKDTRVIERWMQGGVDPYKDADQRIRLAFQIARTLGDHDSPRVVQAWFTGLNPELQDRAPIRLLREENIEKVGPELLNAMRAFLAGG